MDIAREEMLRTLQYFWEEKEDIERWTGYDRAKVADMFPEVVAAWENYKIAKRMLTAVLRGIE